MKHASIPHPSPKDVPWVGPGAPHRYGVSLKYPPPAVKTDAEWGVIARSRKAGFPREFFAATMGSAR